MLSVRQFLDDTDDDSVAEQAMSIVRKLVESGNYVAKNDLNLAYIVRVLAAKQSKKNERLLIRIYDSPHGYGSEFAPNIRRDIVLTMAKWNARYWLTGRRQSFVTDHDWIQRAFRVATHSMSDEGRHWRRSNKAPEGSFEAIVADWASERMGQSGWSVPV